MRETHKIRDVAKSRPWGERTGAERRSTLGRFGVLYGVIAVVALVLGWIPIGVIFAFGAAGLFLARTMTTDRPVEPERPKPDWMLAMDDPDAPDLSLPEYRTRPRTGSDPSPFAPPEGSGEDPPVTGGAEDPRSPED